MKALNRKERLRVQWTIGLLFVPMILITVIGTGVHFKVLALQVGDLAEKEQRYNQMFEAQAKQGEVMEELINGLQSLRDCTMTMGDHQIAQQGILRDLMKMQAIQPEKVDSATVKLDRLPALYDSLGSDIAQIQSVRDSIATCKVELNNSKFQLTQCLDKLEEGLDEKRKQGK